ncbi:MAG: transposase [Methanotrichaceae archaeon]
MAKVFRYRLSPTKAQIAKLNEQIELCRWTYNETLALRKNTFEQEGKSVSYFESKRMLPIWKESKPELKSVHSQVLQDVVLRVNLAFNAFFRRVQSGEEDPGYPRFKGKNRYDSISYPQSGFSIEGNNLWLSKIGELKFWLHRPIEGYVKRLTIRRSATKKWYVSFLVDESINHILEPSKKVVGIDMGITNFAVLSNGEFVENPRFLLTDEDKLKVVQSKRDKLPKGSHERGKASKAVSHLYERVTNRRENFAQQLSRKWINTYGTICFEDLNITKMVHNHNLAKNILDAAWNKLVQYTSYKAVDAGRRVVLVNPANTSQMCSGCGQIVKKDLSIRVHDCPYCGLSMDRDLNASKNILRLGLQSLAKA